MRQPCSWARVKHALHFSHFLKTLPITYAHLLQAAWIELCLVDNLDRHLFERKKYKKQLGVGAGLCLLHYIPRSEQISQRMESEESTSKFAIVNRE